ncbi:MULTISPECIES: glutamine synthetase family protein [Mesorhizobium]|uniref:Glutamine synthetase family protein n=2 Tax=Mesorhizobium TaxID=68287 RepID=A0ABU5AUV2_9HYPH|nr:MULTISPECIES: glutamine synthetase family protein [Mesorhizobium]MDX8436881.1 glutamine synthetase family protein [Mesorhizobium abyssinicae]MDX8541089.1 glutamine synthetase family protein [Mesorhizobium abyssinicae]RUW18450.1 glutamine synthetase [Mesorhizobium sp. M4B.F.Ca.ET.013.02.1.1]RUW75452.1 glutamine synthetase [Mesorhizobium sp. M4B.F.Ca.ET.049.02.1.2]RVD21502.1 glutamine synthetase [Mesorhizobium sp. M4B.F.Ca.ET.017.02.2.1]
MPPAKKEVRPSSRGGRARTPAFVKSQRGVKNWKEVSAWLEWRGIEDIECITPDQAGVARGKMMPSKKFTSNTSLALPSAVFMTTISGGYPEDGNGFHYPEDDGDLKLMPDLSTLTVVPWEEDPTAAVICDLVHQDGRSVEFTPRNVLKRVLAAYADRGLKPVVAPEIEFYLVRKNPDPDYPLTPPVGRSGRPIGGGAGYSIAGVNEFDELIDDIYHFSEGQGLEIDTLIHEEGAGQLEINLRHGDPIELADQVFMFKRTIREAALKHEIYATFMAKPIQGQPGSAMHIHQSIVDRKTGRNVFSAEDGSETDDFFHFIGGMQKHVPNALVMFAPYVNSYRRLTQAASAPVNNKWGYDNRTTAFRVPRSDPAARRVENRIPSSDANPYLALAASLACGLIGMINKVKAEPPVLTTANADEIDLPRSLLEAVDLFEADEDLGAILGKSFTATYAAIKRAEFETFMEVISPWEREYLLLNV